MIFVFEDIDAATLPLLPLAARRALDVAGVKLPLKVWQGMPLEARRALVAAGAHVEVDVTAVREALAGAGEPIAADDESRLDAPRAGLGARWLELSPLERFAIAHLDARGRQERLAEALREIVGLSHLNAAGEAHMVDVADKATSIRKAVARAVVVMAPETAARIATAEKGDVLATARIAGIMAAKKTPELIPLCHQIAVTRVAVDIDVAVATGRVTVLATAEARDRTGVEMEAMVAASVASLTIYDMLKAVERGIAIEQVVLVEKSGGRSGHYRRDENEARDDAEQTGEGGA